MTDQHLDRAIDGVARRMTSQDAPADLRGRVLDRIGDRARPHEWWRLAAIAAGVVAVAAVGYTLTTREPGRARSAAAPAVISAAPAVASGSSDPNASGALPVATQNRASAGSSADRVAALTTEELAWLKRAVPAIERPEALGLEQIQPPALTIPQIDLKPLVTEPLSVSSAEGGGVKR